MTIRYSNGYSVEAFLLSRNETSMRVAIQGSDDVLELNEINGVWITEDCEPVQIQFEWMRNKDLPVVTVDDCVCPHDLAARLLHLLFSGENDPEIKAELRRQEPLANCRQVV
jgi:hypothetical protein